MMELICPNCAGNLEHNVTDGRETDKPYLCTKCTLVWDRSEVLISMIDAERYAKAISHPIREAILHQISVYGSISPVQAAKNLGEGLSLVSYHFSILAGKHGCSPDTEPLIRLVDTKPRRGATEHFYTFNREAVPS